MSARTPDAWRTELTRRILLPRGGLALLAALWVAVWVAACSGGDSTAPPKAANVTNASDVAISGTVGAALATPPQFVVRDASGHALANVAVTIVVSGGGGTLAGAPTKTAAGMTSVGTWTLGTTSGANTLTVTVNDVAPLVISATGTPGPVTQMLVASGSGQSAVAASALASPVTFKAADKFGNGVPGVPVTFQVTAGGGSLASATGVNSDASGNAAAPAWTLGKSTNSQSLQAATTGASVTAFATVSTNFSLVVRFFGPTVDPTIQAAFTMAAQRIQGFVTGDLPDVPLTSFDISSCAAGVAPLTETIDDVVVYAHVAPIDGVGGILGSAGPCFVRVTGGLSLIGVMNFDVADLQTLQTNNQLNDVILHEMLHTLGFGTLWASKGQVTGAGTPNSAFIGNAAIAGCQFHGGGANCATSIPLETNGGAGTRDVHWRKNTTATGIGFKTELMTGFISAPGVPNPLSRMTIGSLADLGYIVNLLPNDPYTVPSSLAAQFGAIRESQGLGATPLNDIVLEPIGAVDASGHRVPLSAARK